MFEEISDDLSPVRAFHRVPKGTVIELSEYPSWAVDCRVNRVPISHEAVALIRLRRDAVPNGCQFLFPGDVPGQPVVDLKRFWERMRVQADIPDVRIHDLRHTFASLLVSGGASLEMIGRRLGHTQIGTTQRYAHLIDSPLRAGVNAVGEMLKPRSKVVAG